MSPISPRKGRRSNQSTYSARASARSSIDFRVPSLRSGPPRAAKWTPRRGNCRTSPRWTPPGQQRRPRPDAGCSPPRAAALPPPGGWTTTVVSWSAHARVHDPIPRASRCPCHPAESGSSGRILPPSSPSFQGEWARRGPKFWGLGGCERWKGKGSAERCGGGAGARPDAGPAGCPGRGSRRRRCSGAAAGLLSHE